MNLQLTRKDYLEIFETAICWIVVFAMFVYGFGKITQFDGALLANANKKISELKGMELMWSFYGYSLPFVLIVGFIEVTGGLLLLYKKTRLVGCLVISTVLINVILQDYFFQVNVGALKAAILYQIIIIIILFMHKEQLLTAIKSLILKLEKHTDKKIVWLKIGLSLILFAILRITEFYLTAY